MYKHRRALLTRTNFLTGRQKQRLVLPWKTDDIVVLLATWEFYQDLVGAYGHPDRSRG